MRLKVLNYRLRIPRERNSDAFNLVKWGAVCQAFNAWLGASPSDSKVSPLLSDPKRLPKGLPCFVMNRFSRGIHQIVLGTANAMTPRRCMSTTRRGTQYCRRRCGAGPTPQTSLGSHKGTGDAAHGPGPASRSPGGAAEKKRATRTRGRSVLSPGGRGHAAELWQRSARDRNNAPREEEGWRDRSRM